MKKIVLVLLALCSFSIKKEQLWLCTASVDISEVDYNYHHFNVARVVAAPNLKSATKIFDNYLQHQPLCKGRVDKSSRNTYLITAITEKSILR